MRTFTVFGQSLGMCTCYLGRVVVCALGIWAKFWYVHLVFGQSFGMCTWYLGKVLVCALGIWAKFWYVHLVFGQSLGMCTWEGEGVESYCDVSW